MPEKNWMAEDPDASSEPFELLASEIRLDIVRALGEAMAGGEHTPLAFSELQGAVGVDDNGKFNYHLSQVLGTFVEKVEEGYRLKPTGISVFQSVKAGTYSGDVTVEPTKIGDACVTCDGETSIWYEDGRVFTGCESCDDVNLRYPLPPGTFDREDFESLVRAASTRISRDYRSFLRGVCPYCSGRVASTIRREIPNGITDELSKSRSVFGSHSCRRCYWFVQFSLETGFQEYPAIVSFLYERGLNLFDVRPWNAPYEYAVEERSTDPLRVAVTYEYDGDSRTLVVDGSLDVVTVED